MSTAIAISIIVGPVLLYIAAELLRYRIAFDFERKDKGGQRHEIRIWRSRVLGRKFEYTRRTGFNLVHVTARETGKDVITLDLSSARYYRVTGESFVHWMATTGIEGDFARVVGKIYPDAKVVTTGKVPR